MSIRLTPEGKYYYRFQYKHRNFCEGGYRTKQQALDAETVTKDRAIRGVIVPEQIAAPMAFAEIGRLYVEKSPSKKTLRHDDQRLMIMAPYFKQTPLKDITAQQVMEVLNKAQAARKFSDHTWNHYQATVRKVVNWLKEQNLFAGENVAEKVKQRKVPKARVRFFYPSEQKTLNELLRQDPILWPNYWIALQTGMRANEIAPMRVKDVSFLTNTIFIPHSKNYRSRYVPISDDLIEPLKLWVAGKDPEQYVTSGYSAQWITVMFKRVCELAKINDANFHTLRHTFAYNRLVNGVPIYKVSKILGHSSVTVTEDHYGHLAMQDLHDAVNQTAETTRQTTRLAAPKSDEEEAEKVVMKLQWPMPGMLN